MPICTAVKEGLLIDVCIILTNTCNTYNCPVLFESPRNIPFKIIWTEKAFNIASREAKIMLAFVNKYFVYLDDLAALIWINLVSSHRACTPRISMPEGNVITHAR